MKGDRVEIVIDAGHDTRRYDIAATRPGRRVEIRTGRGVVEVSEMTRSGTPVRTARFMATGVGAGRASGGRRSAGSRQPGSDRLNGDNRKVKLLKTAA